MGLRSKMHATSVSNNFMIVAHSVDISYGFHQNYHSGIFPYSTRPIASVY
jgi:hypothetical protein